jgi:hypothetical protein
LIKRKKRVGVGAHNEEVELYELKIVFTCFSLDSTMAAFVRDYQMKYASAIHGQKLLLCIQRKNIL